MAFYTNRAFVLILNYLHLHNFMSYADAVLDLSGISVACLTGPNGAGKSALLDAVTWALWEEARSGSDELVRLGEKEMWVEVIFAHESRLYKVRRSRQKAAGRAGGRGLSKGTLELMVADAPVAGDGDSRLMSRYEALSWMSLTANGMKETGRHIQDLLRMDFDTFINSAYLKQGRAEEFTTRPPGERKQVLSEILGLSYFDRLQEETREQARNVRARIDLLSQALKAQETTEDRLSTTIGELQIAHNEYDELGVLLVDIEAKVLELTEQIARLKLVEVGLVAGEARQRDLGASILRLQEQRVVLAGRISEHCEAIAAGGDIAGQMARFNSVRDQVEKLDGLALKFQDLTEKKVTRSGELARERSRLEMSLEQVLREASEQEKQLSRLQKEVSDEEKIRAAYNEYKVMLASEVELSARQEAYAQITTRINDLSNSIQESRIHLEAELFHKERALVEVEELMGSADGLAAEGEELEAMRLELDRLEVEFDSIEKKGLTIKSLIESSVVKIAEINIRQRENLEKIRELKEHEHSPVCPLCSATIVDRAAVIERYLQHNRDMDREIANIEAANSQHENELDELRQQFKETRKQLDRRKELDNRIGRFNERERAVERARNNGERLAREKADLQVKLNENNFAQVERESLINLKVELARLDFDPVVYTSLQAQIRLKRHVESRYQQLLRDLDELKKLEEKLPLVTAECARLTAELSSESYGGAVRLILKQIVEEIEALGYDRIEHGRLKDELKVLFAATEKIRDLRKALEEKPRLEVEHSALLDEIAAREQQLTLLRDDHGRMSAELSHLAEIQMAVVGLNPTLEELRERKQAANLRVAVLTERMQGFEQELVVYRERVGEKNVLQEEFDDLSYLAEAFGKKGIQAVIIENAIPEIEAETNRILSRLTDNKMHVALITQSKNKSGGMSETLDLVMGDEVGTRAYELYSGGEAFKVNFALRIALARLLARRAGAKLETLIIDEGFGSQDDASRDKLVRAIRMIQSDFSRVLVITHISEVKEMFPVQIQVSKKNGISSFQLVS
ncbi:MAG: SMC family ATPase [Cyanobacteria bacterium REEB67]|nr:SMC family ATPase [Cyanobacteria bacterium REEB67]